MFTRERVVPIISASVPCETAGNVRVPDSSVQKRARSRSVRAQPLLARAEQLVHEVFSDANVARGMAEPSSADRPFSVCLWRPSHRRTDVAAAVPLASAQRNAIMGIGRSRSH